MCKVMTRTAKWAKARWEDNTRRMLSSNQLNLKQWWSLVKERQGVASHERIQALTLSPSNSVPKLGHQNLTDSSPPFHDLVTQA